MIIYVCALYIYIYIWLHMPWSKHGSCMLYWFIHPQWESIFLMGVPIPLSSWMTIPQVMGVYHGFCQPTLMAPMQLFDVGCTMISHQIPMTKITDLGNIQNRAPLYQLDPENKQKNISSNFWIQNKNHQKSSKTQFIGRSHWKIRGIFEHFLTIHSPTALISCIILYPTHEISISWPSRLDVMKTIPSHPCSWTVLIYTIPKSSIFLGIFYSKSSIWRYPPFLEPP